MNESSTQRTTKPHAKRYGKDIRQKSVGAIILNAKSEVLIMHSAQNKYWEFPKGKVEKGEKELDTLKREMFEETGIRRFRLHPAFREYLRYSFRVGSKIINKVVVYYLFKTGSEIKISDEHTAYKWVSLVEVEKSLKHENQRKLIKRVKYFLEENEV
ncbi:MAG: NUDIX domain-containing protein [bacterium]|nr:NUDIX domain-containing protein [bacterium]